jgi:serine/threonine protein kinase
LTVKVGSIPYMAPEVMLAKPYNEKCDVFSFGILLYEIISLKPPYHLSVKKGYLRKVAQGGRRPKINPKWPSMTKDIMSTSWAASPRERPSMKSICKMIKVDLMQIDTRESIKSRLDLIANISRHSSSRYSTFEHSFMEDSRN